MAVFGVTVTFIFRDGISSIALCTSNPSTKSFEIDACIPGKQSIISHIFSFNIKKHFSQQRSIPFAYNSIFGIGSIVSGNTLSHRVLSSLSAGNRNTFFFICLHNFHCSLSPNIFSPWSIKLVALRLARLFRNVRQVRPCLTCKIVQRKTKLSNIIKVKWLKFCSMIVNLKL